MEFRVHSSEVPMFEIDASGEVLRCALLDLGELVEMALAVTEISAPRPNRVSRSR